MKGIKFFLLFLFVSPFLAVFFVAAPVEAAEKVLPEHNPMCWSKEWCKAEIEFNGWTFAENNFELGGPDNICGKELGVCIPAGHAQTGITIGGKKEYAHLGDYIKTVYTYLVGVGGIVAVVMLIWGGFTYLTAAGSPERISSAKSTIGSSLLGMLLLVGSYTLLYTINPDLVRLRV
ncbi:MAG: hypothetical protein HY982_02820, partial [Candidatus Magasanikbacteria bacterium]|nr:hypothetical protein [Candidatus Magasanikbacteria bacterium]